MQRSLHSNKHVEPVSTDERELVHLLMHLSSLASSVDKVTAAQLAEHRLALVTTSTTCNSLLAMPFSEAGDLDADYGDGMAPPASVVRANAERMASAVGRGAAPAAAGWVEPVPGAPGAAGGDFREPALDQLTAQSDHDGLQGGANGALSRVAALQRQVQRAAAAAVKAGAPLASQAASATSRTLQAAAKSVSHQQAHAPAPAAVTPVQKRAASPAPQPSQTSAWDCMATEDEGAQEGPSPEVLLHAAAAAAREAGPSAQRAASQAAQAVAGGFAASLARARGEPHIVYQDPASQWLVVDSPDEGVRHLVIAAPAALEAAFGGTAEQQRLAARQRLVTFETYSLGAKVNRALYEEAVALYNRFMPLVLDHLEENPRGRVCLSGAGLGGSLASLLTLMMAHRGLRHSALAPAVALNAPAVLCEVPDFSRWCGKDGCSLEEVGAMVDDAVSRGVLAELGLPPTAVMNVYYNAASPDGSGGAEAAAAAASVSLAGGRNGPAAAARGALRRLDGAVLRQVERSALVPEALKAWLRAEGDQAPAGGVSGVLGLGGQPLQILYPMGRILWYEPPKSGSARAGPRALSAHA